MSVHSKYRVSLPTILVILLVLLFENIHTAHAFDGTDREPPRISKLEVVLSPNKANDWRLLITFKTIDDKNLVSPPTWTMKLAFPWKANVATPAPKCLKGALLDIPLSTFEQTASRVIDTESVQQVFLILGRVPIRPVLEKSCPEFRDFSRPPVLSLNGRGILTTYTKGSSVPNYQGTIFEPKLQDASGRINDPKSATNAISSAKLLPDVWPDEPKEICLSQVSTNSVIDLKPVFQSLDQEHARAIDIGNPTEFPEVSLLQATLNYASELQQIIEGKTESLSSFPLCSKMIDGRSLSSQLKGTISKIKKSNDDYLKTLAAQSKQIERENASRLAEERNAKLNMVEETLKEINSEYAQLSTSYTDLTRTSSVQKVKTSSGSKEKSQTSSKALEDRKKIREQISGKNQELLDWNSAKFSIEREADFFTDNLSKIFYQKLLSKYEQVRLARVKTISLLLRFDQLYTKLAS